MIATYPPPRGPGPFVRAVFWTVVVANILVGASVRAARSEELPVIGYRLEVGLCSGNDCQVILESVEPWTVKKSCEDEGDLVLEAARPKPGGSTVQTRCVPVRGDRST